MSKLGSILSIKDLKKQEVFEIYERAKIFKKALENKESLNSILSFKENRKYIAALLFFESSTRTQMNFQMSCAHLNLSTVLLSSKKESSISKGESYKESVLNISSMNPDLIVIRSSGNLSHLQFEENTPALINAGMGTDEHPTQALLDVFTILEKRNKKDLKGEKILIVGDVLHSRVANSNLPLMQALGAEVAICCPEGMTPILPIWDKVKSFDSLEEGLKWADVCMGLRVQLERHTSINLGLTRAEYRNHFCLNKDKMKHFKKDGLILHPGPFILELDFSESLLKDPRCCVRDQVKNGVYVRSSLISMILDAKVN